MPENRVQLIKSIEKPINFLVLILLMVETLLGGMAFRFEEQRDFLIYTIIIFFGVYTLAIILIAFFKPEALQGTRKWKQYFAQGMADDIYKSLEGYLSNLEEGEQHEAWLQLSDLLRDPTAEDKEFKAFSEKIADCLDRNINIRKNIDERRGTIN